MALVVPDVGELYILAAWIAGYPPSSLKVHLYQNNYTPVDSSVLGSFTEATFSGYASAVFAFAAPSEVANKAKAVAISPTVFTHNGGGTANTIYGYFVKDLATGDLVWAERFGSSQIMTNNGDQISLPPQITFDSENH
jgi:hypothetical protein